MITEEDIKTLKITKWQDNEDGSSDVQFECSDTLRNYLAGQGLIYCIKQLIESTKTDFIDFKEGSENHANVDRTD